MRRSAAGVALSAGLLGAALLAGCGGSSGSGSDVPTGAVAVVDGQNITVPQLETTMNIARLSLKTSYPEPGTEQWVSLRSRALESLAHDAELRAWAKNLGVTVKPSAVDAAVKATPLECLPRQDGGQHRPGQGRRRVQEHRHDARAVPQPYRDEAAGPGRGQQGGKVARASRTRRSRLATRRRSRPRTRCRSAASCATSWSRTRRSPISCMRSSSPRMRNSPSSRSSTRPTPPARPTGGELGEAGKTNLVKPFADVAFTIRQGVVSQAGEDAVRLAPDRGRGADPARERASARRDAASCRSAPSSSRRGGRRALRSSSARPRSS